MIKIGLETHCQLNLRSKLFCSCSTFVGTKPNTNTCPQCLGLPGGKPVLNKKAVEHALKIALALNCSINKVFYFSRKTYFYDDLPNNYQITQYELPLAVNGRLMGIRIRRLHIEEDPGRLVHHGSYTLIDYNRSGTALVEIVTEPDFKSPEEARDYLNKLVVILEYLGVYSRKSEATLRTDANISTNNGPRVEIKNINSIKDVESALQYEAERQSREEAVQETRGWDGKKTISYRKKETEDDYGYITEPNLPVFTILDSEINDIKASLPELADARAARFISQYKIDESDATVLTQEIIIAELFEKVARKIDPAMAAKWIRRDLGKLLNLSKKSMDELELDETHIIDLLEMVSKKEITDTTAKEILEKLIVKPFDVRAYVNKQGLGSVSDTIMLEKLCKEAMDENPKAVEDYRRGGANALNFIVGRVMAKTKGKATPKDVNDILKKLL